MRSGYRRGLLGFKMSVESAPNGRRVAPLIKRNNQNPFGLQCARQAYEGGGGIMKITDDLVNHDDIVARRWDPCFKITLFKDGCQRKCRAGLPNCFG